MNVIEPNFGQSPLMWACREGLHEFVALYILQGAHLDVKDYFGWTAAHYAASSKSENGLLYDNLCVGDIDFDAQNNDGYTALHIAVENFNNNFVNQLLLGGIDCSRQDGKGNQPSHIAAKVNNLEALKAICVYDKHIGRLNFSHETALGVAKLHASKDCQIFLEKHYRMIDIEGGRNEVGDIWWDHDIDDTINGWEVVVGFLGEREYINRITGERSLVPPSYPVHCVESLANDVELPMKKNVTLVSSEAENSLTRHEYVREYAQLDGEISDLSMLHQSATCIQKYVRRKLAYKESKWLSLCKKQLKIIAKFIKRHLGKFMSWRKEIYHRAFAIIQAKFKTTNDNKC